MASVNEYLMEEFTRQTVDLMRIEAGMRKTVLGMMKGLELDLISQIQNIDPTAVNAASYKLARLQALLKQTKDTIRTAYRGMRKAATGELTDLVMAENAITMETLNASLGVDIATVAMPRSIALSLARKTAIQGAIQSEWWSRQAASLRRSFSDQLSIGLLAGETNSQLVQRIRGTATGKRLGYLLNGKQRFYSEFSGGIMDTGTRQAEALVRTATQTVAQEARMETFRENSDVVKGVSASVTFDLKTTDVCKGRSGMAWDMDGKPLNSITTESFPGSPPWHWNCRTQLVAVTKSWKELSQRNQSRLGRSPKGLKSSMDGQVAGDLTYEKWLRKRPVADQREALGVAKQKLWKKGKLNFRELVDQTGRPLTVAQLTKKRKK